MKQIKHILFIATWLLISQIISADPVITFFFRNYPDAQLAQQTMNKLRRPDGIAKQQLHNLMNHNRVSGIFATYFGFLNTSNQTGQIIFPRKQSKATFQIIVTNKITPIMMFQSTVSHWELEPGTPAEFYTVELKEDENTKLSFWQTKKAPLPQNNYIPPETSIIIIAKPKNVYVPTGIRLTHPSANLILPDINIKKGVNSIRNALYILNLSFLFQPIDLLYKKEKTKYEQLIKE